jgi:hypothetical protein
LEQSSSNFLIERIRRQAETEGMPLSQEEQMFLEVVSSGHKEEAHEALKKLREHESMGEFGRRLAGLLMRAYEEDVKSDPQAKERYAQQSEIFGRGSGIFSAFLPLVLGGSRPQQGHSPQAVAPKSSPWGLLLALIFLITVGLILWMVITRR